MGLTRFVLAVVSQCGFCARLNLYKKVSLQNEADTTANFFSCGHANSCADCLQRAGPCMWCPATLWTGDAKHVGQGTGVCRKAQTTEDALCADDGWSLATYDDGLTQHVARTEDEANSYCPETNTSQSSEFVHEATVDDEKEWKEGSLSAMTGASIMAMNLENAEELGRLLNQIAMDIRRLQTFKEINPLLFEHQFDPHSTGEYMGYAWKGAILGFGFLDLGFGGVLSSAISLAAGGITDASSTFMKDMRASQKKLIAKGKSAELQYFRDVTFGVLKEGHEQVRELSEEQISELQEELVEKDGGTLAGRFHQIDNSGAGKGMKFLAAAGLFAGGFVTGGATWIIGSGLGVASYAASVAGEEASKTAAKVKMRLLLSLARSREESAWGDAGDLCNITTRDGDDSPCAPKAPPNSSMKPIARYCSRSSTWNDTVEAAQTSPEGRCLPTYSPQLPDGFPCHANSNCKSSYCHYEPRLQYFLSDHTRKHCELGSESCTDAMTQLSTLSKILPIPPSDLLRTDLQKKLRGFVKTYDSLEGVEFATTGTCASACIVSEIGSGDCSYAGHTGKFGLKRKNFLSVEVRTHNESSNSFLEGVRFEKLGEGACVNQAGELSVLKELVMDGEAVHQCAEHCAHLHMSAFEVEHNNGMTICKVLQGRPGGIKQAGRKAVCYDRHLDWPLDVYQPWNRIWRNYRMEIRKILAKLNDDEASALPKIKEAYSDYCKEVPAPDYCPNPRDWNTETAAATLTHVSPLSAKQLHVLFTRVFDQV